MAEISRAHAGAHARVLNILVACEESQAECAAFRALGHRAFSADLQKPRRGGHPEWHILGDVTPLLRGCHNFTTMDGVSYHVPRWDLILAHPPCTYLCKMSAVHMRNGVFYNESRFQQMLLARDFFFECLNTCAADYVAVENPLPMAIANLPKPSCFIQPYWFGVPYSKKTLYWLRGLPPIMPTVVASHYRQFVWCSRGKYRSRTFPEVAQAVARQWSEFILNEG